MQALGSMLEDVQSRGRIVDNIPAGILLHEILEEAEEATVELQQQQHLLALRVLDGLGRNSCFSDHPDSSRITVALFAALAAFQSPGATSSSSFQEALAAKAAETVARISMKRSAAIALLLTGRMEKILIELVRIAEGKRARTRAQYAIVVLLSHPEVSEEAAKGKELFDGLLEQVREQLVGDGNGRTGGARRDGSGAEGSDEAAGAMVSQARRWKE